ncbi:hypothetical protein MN116_008163 [Schistosoma mekongi]|uniref:GSKIP domain-containing protein n=2 Tax=Schistosoma mekongi TaxID=38744 RepID=A0AAE2D1R9_SCHME|nr:hypothetical protein MN116_008163 [Schistosoma mekongi]
MSAAAERTDPAGYFHNDDNHEDVKLCSIEAKAAIAEVGFGVKEICLASSSLPFTDTLAYLNLTTLEGESMCVEISVKGFCPVGSSYDEVSEQSIENSSSDGQLVDCRDYYETIYALLSERSQLFRECFSQRLSDRLEELRKRQSKTTTDENCS